MIRFVLVGSGTRWAAEPNRADVTEALTDLADFVGIEAGDQVDYVHGDAQGFDRMSAGIAAELGWHPIPVPARWQECGPGCPPGKHLLDRHDGRGTFCPLAGPRRNQKMLDEYRPSAMLAMPEMGLGGKSSGTRDAIQRAADAGLTVIVRALRVEPRQPALLPRPKPALRRVA